MTVGSRGAVCVLVLAVASLGVVAAPARAARSTDPSDRLFDPSRIHEVAFEVSPPDVATLGASTPDTQTRVPAKVTVDGVTVANAGVRLKGYLTFQALEQKPGFSVKLDEYVPKAKVFGVDRFTLGNEVYDPSFVAEHVTYEVFRRAGIPAPRTALAHVSFNGELLGLYVLREAYDKDFLRRNFADPGGNLYEAPSGADLSDPRLEARTNELRNDKSDVLALQRVVQTASDDVYVQALGKLVDLRELFTYWAVEELTAHWDGYTSVTNVPFGNTDPAVVMGNVIPNNYYAYRPPGRGRFVVLPWGADWTLGNWLFAVALIGSTDPRYVDPRPLGGAAARTLVEPKTGATTMVRLGRMPGTEARLRTRILAVLDRAWDVPALLARADQIAALVRADGLHGTRETFTLADFESGYAARRQFIESRPAAVRAELGAGG